MGRAGGIRLSGRWHQWTAGRHESGHGKIKFVQVRHEEMAAFMASAYAKFSGRLGVCLATSGPGATHLITGMYDARLDHMPLLAIAGQQARAALGGHYQQEIDLPSAYKDVAGAMVQQASVRPKSVISSIARSALRRASVASPPSSCPTTCRMSRMRNRRARTARFTRASASRRPRSCPTKRISPRGGSLQQREEGRDTGRCRCTARHR